MQNSLLHTISWACHRVLSGVRSDIWILVFGVIVAVVLLSLLPD